MFMLFLQHILMVKKVDFQNQLKLLLKHKLFMRNHMMMVLQKMDLMQDQVILQLLNIQQVVMVKLLSDLSGIKWLQVELST